MNRTLVKLACAMLTDSKLPLFLWELAVTHATYLRNLSYTSAKPAATPYQGWTGKKPNVSHLHEFGAPIWVLLQGQSIQKKMLPKSQCCAYVGYDDGSKAIKYYNAATKNILLSRNFRFLMLSEPTPPEDIIIENPPEDQGENSPLCKGEVDSSTCSGAKNQTTIPQKRTAESNIDPREPRRMRGILLDYKYLNDPFPDEEEAGIASVAKEEAFMVLPDDDCKNISEAKASPEWLDWERAMQTELDQLKRMGTWRHVEKPPDVVPIGNKWVYVKKRDKEGQLIKYKARLVAKGYAQRPGYNYLETHSLVVRLKSIQALLAIAATHKLYMHQIDIKGAYLNSILKECVYMQQPEGFEDGTGHICLLVKSLYSLKQAGREWNIEMDTKMRKQGYVHLQSDHCVYIYRVSKDFVIITVWVDDMLLFATTIKLKDKAKADIEAEWEITDLGKPSKIVGIEIMRTPDAIAISSSKYIESILIKEGLGRSNSVSTPLDPNIPLEPNPEGNFRSRSNSFARLLRELQYIANATCPDITYAKGGPDRGSRIGG